LNPHHTAKKLLDGLIQQYPEKYTHRCLRTLQRRVASWKNESGSILNKERLTLVSKNSDTSKYVALVLNKGNAVEQQEGRG